MIPRMMTRIASSTICFATIGPGKGLLHQDYTKPRLHGLYHNDFNRPPSRLRETPVM